MCQKKFKTLKAKNFTSDSVDAIVEMKFILEKMKNRKATGPDSIKNSDLLKYGGDKLNERS